MYITGIFSWKIEPVPGYGPGCSIQLARGLFSVCRQIPWDHHRRMIVPRDERIVLLDAKWITVDEIQSCERHLRIHLKATCNEVIAKVFMTLRKMIFSLHLR